MWNEETVLVIWTELVEGKQYHSILEYKACVSLGLLEIKDNDKLRPLKPCKGANVYTTQTGSEILTKESIFKQYPKVFRETVGELATQYRIQVNELVSPVQHALKSCTSCITFSSNRRTESLRSCRHHC